jgi:flagellar basal-body rod protein FlgG
MDAGLYIAAQGMLAEQVRQDQLSNNLSNASTPGYKPQGAEQQSFDSLLLKNTATGQSIGSIQAGVTIKRVVTDSTPSALHQTNQPLEFGIAGEGYFAVKSPDGVRYTRDGQFSSNAGGELVDANGNLVLSQSGAPVKVSAQGTVAGTALGVFNVPNASQEGNDLLSGRATGQATGVVHAGELEDSGVDPISTMTDMIASLRAYQSGQSAIQSIDQTMQEDATSVGSVPGR